jgi:surface antigen
MTATTTNVGRFRFGSATDRWWWSDHLFLVHGMQPGDVVPTRELLMAHVQRDDRPLVGETLQGCLESAEPRGCAYELLDLSGTPHRVVLAVGGDGTGDLTGFLVDVTAAQDAQLAHRVNTELALALESHAAIDQAKGVPMLTYGVDDDAAFEILRQSSQINNVRLRTLADRVVEASANGLDHTARERVDETLTAALSTATAPVVGRRDQHLELHADNRDDSVLRVSGCVDLSNREQLAQAITLAMLRVGEGGNVTVDLRDAVRLGPVVADVLASALRQPVAHHVTMTIIGGGFGTGEARRAATPARQFPVASRS